ncbi:hypothetical protein [Mycobacterium timonense]|uniref:Peptidoglycan-binding protein n=1 Tax=Mycobacterium timonense TaxID=701043 RepID=A0ABX3TSH4_9MYCO|nr:hypothetical protein [Mycobacterium timonense]ORB81789.1 hypothetical protein BST46_01980 [Mycobacterium timonense]
MATDANGKWIGLGVGDVDDPHTPRNAPNWTAITLLQQKLHDKYTWARAAGIAVTGAYDRTTAVVVEQFCRRVGLPVITDPHGLAVANLATRTRLGSYPPPPPPRHAMLTIRGTGGIIGQDYTSQIAQAASATHYEVPIDYAASMGGIPVAAATDPEAPSGNDAAAQAYQLVVDWLESTTASFSLCAYSLGSKGAVMVLNDLFTPGRPLNKYAERFVCAVMVADPWRPFGHTFYLGPIPDGQGIGAPYYTLTPEAIAALGWRICWLANPTDLYTNSPLGATGQVLADVEEIVLETAISDPLGSIQRAIPYLLRLVEKDGGLNTVFGAGQLGGILTWLSAGTTVLTAGLAGLLLPVFESAFAGLIAGISGNGSNLPPGIAADMQAAILALKFYGSGIRGHVSYHDTPWGSGPQTYLQLGVQHANDYGSRVSVAT